MHIENSYVVEFDLFFRSVSFCIRLGNLKDASMQVKKSVFRQTGTTQQTIMHLLEEQKVLSLGPTEWKETLRRLKNYWIPLLRFVLTPLCHGIS